MVADRLRSTSFALALSVGFAGVARGEISTDGTVGPRLRLEGPEFAVGAGLGTRAGQNLFHSFERFSLATGERATFSGPAGTRNVISRVTGGERSDIDGTIRSTVAGADFFFINPAGVLFGPNASLDVQGSFHVSTADELRFADGAAFSATHPASSLTVASPEAFGFLGAAPAGITALGSALEVSAGAALSLVGGDVTLGQSLVRAEAGRITLAAAGGPGEVLLASGAIAAERKADIRLTGSALVDSSGNGGGGVSIRGGNFVVQNAFVFADNDGPVDAVGGIDVDADQVQVTGGSVLSTDVLGSGRGGDLRVDAAEVHVSEVSLIGAAALDAGTAGAVRVAAGELEIGDGSAIRNSTFSTGDAGRITVEADRLLIRGSDFRPFTGIAGNAEPGSVGDAGTVEIAAGEVEIREGGAISSATFSDGSAGTITIEAGRLLLSGDGSAFSTQITTSAEPGSSGAAGAVQIAASEVEILPGGIIASATFADRDAGTVTIEADRLLLRGGDPELVTGITSSAEAGAGNAGAVRIVAGDLEVRDGSEIRSGTSSAGDAGTVRVEADRLLIQGDGSPFLTGITSSSNPGATGDAGSVQIAGGELQLLAGGEIRSATFGAGDAGAVTVAADRLLVRGLAGISSSAGTTVTGDVGQGDAGQVRIQAQTVELDDGGRVSSSADGPGTAGDVIIAADRLILEDAVVDTATVAGGGGEIQLLVGKLIDLHDSAIVTSVGGGADPTAGNILIDPTILIIDGSRIRANAPAGFGGQVRIVADNVLVPGGAFEALLARGDISASGGDPTRDGTIVVNAPEVDLSAGLLVLEGNFIDPTRLRGRCGARRDVGASSFTGVGRTGLPPSPDTPLTSALHGIQGAVGTASAAAPPLSARWPAASAPPCAPRS